jgi:hypothetical protein
MKDDAIDFSQFMAAVARALLGEPTRKKGHKYLLWQPRIACCRCPERCLARFRK